MSDEPVNLMLEYLRALRADMTGLRADVSDLKHRLTAVEIGLANLASAEASHYASVALRSDRADDRLDRIEKRLDLSEAPRSA